MLTIAVADLGCLRGDAPTQNVRVKSYYLPNSPENCVKIREIGPRGDARPWRLLQAANGAHSRK